MRARRAVFYRLRTVPGAGKIAAPDQGRLAEEGPAARLPAKAGPFARLYTIRQESPCRPRGESPQKAAPPAVFVEKILTDDN
jgi:hypothetical protein